jgi:tetratricopeptide (TPR) repeat protein
VHCYYAQALFEEIAGSGTGTRVISNLPTETAETMRAQLKQAIALEPTFSEAYRLLSFVYLITSENLDEAETLLKRAIELNPGRGELGYSLAQIYMRQQKFEDARASLDALIKYATDPKLREQATNLLESVNRMAAAYARYAPGQAKPIETVEKEKEGEFKEIAVAPRPALRRKFEGEKAEGVLLKMDCTKGLTVTVKGAKETWQFHSATPDRVQFVTYSQDVSAELTCSAFKMPPSVIVTYRYNTDAQAKHDGELIAIEFVKAP